MRGGTGWWAVTGSNRRPSRCKRDALPTELTALAPSGIEVFRRFRAIPPHHDGKPVSCLDRQMDSSPAVDFDKKPARTAWSALRECWRDSSDRTWRKPLSCASARGAPARSPVPRQAPSSPAAWSPPCGGSSPSEPRGRTPTRGVACGRRCCATTTLLAPALALSSKIGVIGSTAGTTGSCFFVRDHSPTCRSSVCCALLHCPSVEHHGCRFGHASGSGAVHPSRNANRCPKHPPAPIPKPIVRVPTDVHPLPALAPAILATV